MKARFVVANSFMQENHINLEKLFGLMIIIEKNKLPGGDSLYTAESSMFDNQDSTNFIIGFKDEKFKAFPENSEIPEGWLLLNQRGATFENWAEQLYTAIKKGKTKVEELAENIDKANKKLAETTPNIPDYKNMTYRPLMKFAKKEGFKPNEHKDSKKPTIIKFLDEKFAETKEPEKPEPDNVDFDDINFYKVIEPEKVKNETGFLEVGSVIGDNMNFETPISTMLENQWIEKIKED